MPTYDYKCKSCDELFEKNVKIAQMNDPQECPYCGESDSEKFIGGAPALGDPVRLGVRRIDNGFKETLQRIDSLTPGSTLKDNSRYL